MMKKNGREDKETADEGRGGRAGALPDGEGSLRREDEYRSFRELRAAETSGVDYRIRIRRRDSPVAVIAPHGGGIEPGISALALAIAGNDFSVYRFEGLRPRPYRHLHITSTRFDEPRCLRLVRQCNVVVAVHGLKGTTSFVDVGGRDHTLRDRICAELKRAGVSARVVTTGDHAAVSPSNICNRGRHSAGVQLELTRVLRTTLRRQRGELQRFAGAVRAAIKAQVK